MKTNFVVTGLLCIAFCSSTHGQTNNQNIANIATNTFLLNSGNLRDETGQEQSHYVTRLLNHKLVPEFLPASQDTNGNWGQVMNGLQLSLRFRLKEYVAGDVIPAITILRNLEFHPRTLLVTNSPSFFFTFLVHNGTNEYLQERKRSVSPRRTTIDSPELLPPTGLTTWEWEARSEKEIALNLNGIFDLSQPGEYSVQAICRVFSPETKTPIYEVSSGTASFRILPKPPSP